MNKFFLAPILALAMILGLGVSSASAATVSHTIYSKANCGFYVSPNPFCYTTRKSIGTATTTSTYSGRSLTVSLKLAYDAKRSGLVWQGVKIRTTCKSTTSGSSVLYYKTASKVVYKRVTTGRNTAYMAGALALRTTCPTGTRAVSFRFSSTFFYDQDGSTTGGLEGRVWATST